MKTVIIILILGACLFFIQSASYAEMYKYVDEKGQVHYTNVPPQNAPPSGKIEKIEPQGGVSILGTEYEDPEPSGKLNSILDSITTKLKKIKEPEQKHENRVELYSTTW